MIYLSVHAIVLAYSCRGSLLYRLFLFLNFDHSSLFISFANVDLVEFLLIFCSYVLLFDRSGVKIQSDVFFECFHIFLMARMLLRRTSVVAADLYLLVYFGIYS